MASILKKIFNKSNKTMTEETSKFSKDSQNILRAWAKNLREKYKKEEYSSDEVFKDPLFLIEWDDAGINARTNINPADTKMALINLIRGQAGCSPFPQQAPSDCAFAFDNRQNLLLMVGQ
ncbi:unnamed protein product [Rhizophagus irregularis]|uniref:Uncharacterized protein n=1 Tax=Rhizophagus irregularis TaxID=588596 RepID=A0A2I1H2R7_9GLOM|nr:hypothetical protein RhiirA4_447524 [Rhizophagus irregularis]CAB4404947.1 unnamed protein product [Rhizophagus irregularis]